MERLPNKSHALEFEDIVSQATTNPKGYFHLTDRNLYVKRQPSSRFSARNKDFEDIAERNAAAERIISSFKSKFSDPKYKAHVENVVEHIRKRCTKDENLALRPKDILNMQTAMQEQFITASSFAKITQSGLGRFSIDIINEAGAVALGEVHGLQSPALKRNRGKFEARFHKAVLQKLSEHCASALSDPELSLMFSDGETFRKILSKHSKALLSSAILENVGQAKSLICLGSALDVFLSHKSFAVVLSRIQSVAAFMMGAESVAEHFGDAPSARNMQAINNRKDEQTIRARRNLLEAEQINWAADKISILATCDERPFNLSDATQNQFDALWDDTDVKFDRLKAKYANIEQVLDAADADDSVLANKDALALLSPVVIDLSSESPDSLRTKYLAALKVAAESAPQLVDDKRVALRQLYGKGFDSTMEEFQECGPLVVAAVKSHTTRRDIRRAEIRNLELSMLQRPSRKDV